MKLFFIISILCGFFYVHADKQDISKGISLGSKTIEQISSDQEKTLRQDNSIQKESLNKEASFLISKEDTYLSEEDMSITTSDLEPYSSSTDINRGVEAFWKSAFKMNTFFYNSRENETIVSTEIYGKINWQLMDFISISTQGLIIGKSGFTQSIYERGARKSGLHIIESYFNLNVSPLMDIRFGNIKQDFLKAPLLMGDKTFPSLIEKFSFDLLDENKLFIVLQQAITDNAVESVRREPELIEGVPLFFTSSFLLDLKEISFLNVDVEERLTGFYFFNLSPAIADRSLIQGNSIDGKKSNARFDYKFLGVYNTLSIKKIISKNWVLELGGDLIYNFLAPSKYNEGDRFFGVLYHNYQNFLEINLTAEYFANQSDTTVAYFNSETYGHNNRKGFLIAAQTHFYDSGLTLGFSYTGSSLINSPEEAKGFSSSFTLFLTTNYMPI